jgi:2-iminobutanoate/2-iminopropanoate deaminase
LSSGIQVEDAIYVSGQGPLDPETREVIGADGEEQANAVLNNVERVLEAADAELDDIIKTTVYLTDMEQYEAVNDAYRERFSEPYPARTAVGVSELPVDILVEIDAVAVLE